MRNNQTAALAAPQRMVPVILAVLVVMAMAPHVQANDGDSESFEDNLSSPWACSTHSGSGLNAPGPDGVDVAHDLCADGSAGCEGLNAAQQALLEETESNCSGWKKCMGSWGRTWEVKGGYKTGEGSVAFGVTCGTKTDDDGRIGRIVECVAESISDECLDGPGPGEGDFGCIYYILNEAETIKDIWGKCVDPASPQTVYTAISYAEYLAHGYNVLEHAETL